MEGILRNVKGTRDFMPEEQGLRNTIRRTLEEVFASHGCKPLETPMLQHYDLLASKYGGGAEILKEVYRLTDQGERDLALRYDLTVPLAKVVGMNPEMRLPFKRYEIGKVFRDGPVKPGRFREFIQCDVDIIGTTSMLAEAELISMTFEAFARLGLDVYIQVNNRKLLSGLLQVMGIAEEQAADVMLSLDKLEKIGVDGVCDDLRERQIEEPVIAKIADFLRNGERSLDGLANRYDEQLVQEGAAELQELFALLQGAGVAGEVRFTPFLARGLSIYTGTVYEIFLKDGRITSSIGSGGRYDKIIGQFLGDGREYPAVGISYGLDVILTALTMGDSPFEARSADVFVIPLGTEAEALGLANLIRKSTSLRVEVELMGRRLKKALDYANKERIPYVLIFGENERAAGTVVVKNMISGEERTIRIKDEKDWPSIFTQMQA
ncbi:MULTISPECIES: histidine--tRNA ligase [Brevibacillus]|uniref:histidine--tRNA ligase n=1 Tax=Brevibacillus TaxID=55080 RepID=UPI001490390B|nr:histidine--tRNA ligase [Brevibacillus borstelensis]MCC0565912.1 histidine--tRNA ligase [Brevibacillus borstelensis]MCM3473085.1 histidine--tRNA ligase [Brevibacillus borstelensis]MCM3561160.1 histidine--tRNA ligase [Brevibacillus borstelensis]MCM3621309.1 histidine--tRNA ligase [Brevibacillus borstelensis]MED1854075.1 histidine--tRNA ligase [Brevibacillus borstelensis]